MHSVLMIFLDGVGIGKEDYQANPFFKYGFKSFTDIFGGIPTLNNPVLKKNNSIIFPSDACLGIEGFPQSGTGQTSIFCGMNAAQYVGKHFGPYPYSTLIPVIEKENIFKAFISIGRKAFFANAYPKVFFDYLKSGKSRLSVTSLSSKLSGLKFNTSTDVRLGRALTAEITNERWNYKLGYKLGTIKPKTSARRLLKISKENSFTLYEYFMTDHLGHGRYDGDAQNLLAILDEFLFTILSELGEDTTLLVCSDHGNVEDISVKTHTLNPALTIASGRYAESLFNDIKDLTQIKPAIMKLFE
ncbi:MAG: metalloenzyme [Ignavibacteriaceae bacterium]|nr:metalloenzyme [Ignavibacteriaceae bacterium]